MSWFKKPEEGGETMFNSNSGGRGSPPEPSPRRPEPREPRPEPRIPAPRIEPRAPESRGPEPRGMDPRASEPRSADPRTAEPRPAAEPRAGDARPGEAGPHASVLGPTLKFRGELTAQEDLIVQGSVEGTITHSQTLTIGTDGSMKGDVRARVIVIDGKVEGDLHASEAIAIRYTAQVKGNVFAPRVSIADGAFFQGQIDMQAAEPPAREATVRIRQLAAAAPEAAGSGS